MKKSVIVLVLSGVFAIVALVMIQFKKNSPLEQPKVVSNVVSNNMVTPVAPEIPEFLQRPVVETNTQSNMVAIRIKGLHWAK